MLVRERRWSSRWWEETEEEEVIFGTNKVRREAGRAGREWEGERAEVPRRGCRRNACMVMVMHSGG